MFEHRFVKFIGSDQPGYELWVVEPVNDSYKLICKVGLQPFYHKFIEQIMETGMLIFAFERGEWVYKKTAER